MNPLTGSRLLANDERFRFDAASAVVSTPAIHAINKAGANARAQKPERWSGKTRNWQPAGPVWLNPERESRVDKIKDAA